MGIFCQNLLGLQVVLSALISFGLLPFGTLGLFWFCEYPDRKTRLRGLWLAGLLPLAFCILLYGAWLSLR